MSNYLVTYTIEDDNVRASINDFLIGLGLEDEVDQSTRYGRYEGTKKQIIEALEAARITYQMGKTDTLILFYANLNKTDEYSIFKKEIV